MSNNDSLVERSKAFAIAAYRAIDHRRKYTGDPYDVHLSAVAELVESVGGTPEMIAAAWLHDTVEDTSTTISDIEQELGSKVAELVDALTDVSRLEDGNRATRKALDRAHLAESNAAAQTVKLADLIDNSLSIQEHDARFAKIYMQEMEQLVEVLSLGNVKLRDAAVEILHSFFSDRNGKKSSSCATT